MKKIITAAAILLATTSAQAFWGSDNNSNGNGYGNYYGNGTSNGTAQGDYRGEGR
ncbi:MAG: VPEID-CTERM sorting domain-containing protein, partial [Gammaproteobacteria bacterium]|nr:VPEID-CTERM sorting domain-containing protein [Gammaproteobacteria bacterium]